jgi:5-methylcytosine-specific restriction endonuclease McrA
MAMLHDRERRHTRDLQRAHVLLDVEQGLSTEVPRQRPAIPREVRHAVFTRDGGRCVECASDFDIQYDHVIPWSMGGADTIQNLQILCAPCNQRKGASI